MHITPPGNPIEWEIYHTETQHHHNRLVDCTHYCYFPQMWESIWMTMSYFILSQSNSSLNNFYDVNYWQNISKRRSRRI